MEYNKNKEYHEEIEPLVNELTLKCRIANMPCFISVAVENTKENTSYINDAVTPHSVNVKLTNDKIADHMNVLNGFRTVPSVSTYSKVATKLHDTEEKPMDNMSWTDGLDIEEIIPD